MANRPMAIIEGFGLIAVGLGFLLASFARVRSQRPGRQVERIYWQDASQAGFAWAAATLLVLLGALGGIDGLLTPIWLVATIVVGALLIGVARLRWSALVAGTPGVDDAGRPGGTRLVSTTWEIGLLGAGVGGLLVYGVTLAHDWGHPVHWLVAGIGVLTGYAIGLLAATPRYAVRRGRA